MNTNLRDIKIKTGSYLYPLEQGDYSMTVCGCDVEVVLHNHKERLLELMDRYPYACGCVAWLTDLDILQAMADMKHVSIIVQKEDFLRPDGNKSTSYYSKLRQSYSALPTKFNRPNIDNGFVNQLSLGSDLTIEPVRCMGNHNKDKNPAFPRMHHKFLIFTDDFEGPNAPSGYLLGISDNACVWTGSYNLSKTSTKSLENAVIIYDKTIAEVYFSEWGQITALSEPLDWESEYCNPELRIGT